MFFGFRFFEALGLRNPQPRPKTYQPRILAAPFVLFVTLMVPQAHTAKT